MTAYTPGPRTTGVTRRSMETGGPTQGSGSGDTAGPETDANRPPVRKSPFGSSPIETPPALRLEDG